MTMKEKVSRKLESLREYAKIDLEEVHRHLQKGLDDFERFSKYIVDYLKKTT